MPYPPKSTDKNHTRLLPEMTPARRRQRENSALTVIKEIFNFMSWAILYHLPRST